MWDFSHAPISTQWFLVAAQTCPQIVGSAPQSVPIQLAEAAHAWASSSSPPHHADPNLLPRTPISGTFKEAEPPNPDINNKTPS